MAFFIPLFNLYNMKNLSVFFFALIVIYNTALAQLPAGTVIYNVGINHGNMKSSNDADYSTFREKVSENAKTQKFRLDFNNKESLFAIVKQMAIDKNDLNASAAINILRGKSIFYSDLNEGLLIEQKDYFGEEYRFKKTIRELKWELTSKKKEIGNYTCYKAIGVKYGSDKENKITEIPIIAWYCPELPYQFGPFEAVGLPGLVLEYELGTFIWIAEDIQLVKEGVKIKVPSSGKLTTEKEIKKDVEKEIEKIIEKNN